MKWCNMSIKIPLTKGKKAIIDEDDLIIVKKYKWRVYKTKTKYKEQYYAITDVKQPNGKNTTLYMHRLIMNVSKGSVVDHINRNGLDNRKKNLKITSQKENVLSSINFDNKDPVYRDVTRYKATITVHVDKSMIQVLNQLSKDIEVSKASIVRNALNLYLKSKYPDYYSRIKSNDPKQAKLDFK
jgi:hypothetical protein